MPKWTQKTRAKKWIDATLDEHFASKNRVYLGHSTDVNEDGRVKVLAYSYDANDPAAVSAAPVTEKTIIRAAFSGVIPQETTTEEKPTKGNKK